MPRPPHDAPPGSSGPDEEEIRLARRFAEEPEAAYEALLATYSPVLLRMAARFFRDPDEVMEVYTSVCERLKANGYAALQRFRVGSAIKPWLSVIVANAARDRMRRTRVMGLPESLAGKLSPFEQQVYREHYRFGATHEEIAESLSYRFGQPFTALDVAAALARINGLLGDVRRWRLIDRIAVYSNPLSIDRLLDETGLEPIDVEAEGAGVSMERQETLRHLADALETLEPEDQVLLQLRFEQGLSAPQIADLLGYESYRYVYTRLQTLFKRLRTTLGPLHG